jgi:hypothetical protein
MARCGRTASHFRRKFHAQIPEVQAARYSNPHLTARALERFPVSCKAKTVRANGRSAQV